MIKKDFNSNWMFSRDVSDMMGALYGESYAPAEITLPHDAMINEPRNENNVTGNAGGFFPGGNYVYSKTFTLDEEEEKKSVLVEFEGVYNRSKVFLNDTYVGGNNNGYTSFYVDLTPHLNYGGENTLTVKVTNKDVPNARWYTGSGIYRPVHIMFGDEARIKEDGIRITTPDVAEDISSVKAEITIKYDGRIRKPAVLLTEIKDDNGTVVSREKTPVTLFGGTEVKIRQTLYVYDAKLWSLDNPNLYTLCCSLLVNDAVCDEAVERFGIRRIQIDPKYGLRVNGEHVMIRGTCMHHDNGVIGSVSLYSAEERRIRKMKEAGFNSIRLGHTPASRALLNACDKLGMLVMEESYDMWNQSKTPYDYATNFDAHWEEDIEAIVRNDFNHPSVFMYCIGNEIGEINRPGGAAINRRLCEKFRECDPTRFVTNAVNGMVATMADIVSVMHDLKLLTDEQYEAMTNPQTGEDGEMQAPSGDINEIMTGLMGQMNLLAIHPKVAEVLDESFSALDTCGYNYMSGRYPIDCKEYPNRIYYGSETLPPDIDINWKYAKEIPQMIGDYTWAGWDYIGEAGIGVPSYGSRAGFFYPYPSYLGHVGDIDITGFRRPMSYYREIVWGLRKEPYIAVQDPSHYDDVLCGTPWIISDCSENWTWTEYENKPVKVEVYSDADEVELLINGVSAGRKPVGELNRFKATFDTTYQSGKIEAVAYKGKEVQGRFELRTASDDFKLRCTPEKNTLIANGQDAAYVSIELTDSNGTVNTAAKKAVTVEVSGAGILQGFGSADPLSTENFFDSERTTYNGRLLAVIRSGHATGEIKIKITSEGCEPCELTLEVVKD